METTNNSEVIFNVPLIPLRDVVVFPSTLVPFIIGRPSSIQALERATEKDKMLFLSSQIDASLDNPHQRDIHSMGVLAKIVRAIKMDDNNVKVIVEGRKRARVVEYLSTYPFYQVLVKEVRDVLSDSPEIQETLQRVLSLFEDYLKISQNTNFESIIPALKDNSPDRISDIIASHMHLPLEEKQNILETINNFERLRRLNFVIENELLKIHSKLRKDGKRTGRRKVPYRDPQQKIFPPGLTSRTR
jgi:ATP-dependent Lon protease